MYYALYDLERNAYIPEGINSENIKQLKKALIGYVESQLGLLCSIYEEEQDVYSIAGNHGLKVEQSDVEFEEDYDFNEYWDED